MSKDNHSVTEYINKSKALGSTYGLTAIKALLACLHHPQDELKVIHVSGTNGKGSVCAFISAILTHAGYKCGVYTSPQVFSFYERFRINGVNITEERYRQLEAEVISVAMEKEILVSQFELETVIAYVYFRAEGCEAAIMEAGCGGLLDATNVTASPTAVCFSSIGLDHMKLLGDTVAEIAANKAGLIKENTIVVSAPQTEDAVLALNARAKACHTEVLYADSAEAKREGAFLKYKGFSMSLQAPGAYQTVNAITSIELALALNRKKAFAISDSDILNGISATRILGRFECIADSVYIDGAHNEPAVWMLRQTLLSDFTNARFTFIIGVLNDKAYAEYLPLITDLAEEIITIPTLGIRGLGANELAACIKDFYAKRVTPVGDIQQAVQEAEKCVAKGNVVVFFGSLSRLDEFKRFYLKDNKNG